MSNLLRRMMQWWAARGVRKYFEEHPPAAKQKAGSAIEPVEQPEANASDQAEGGSNEESTSWRSKVGRLFDNKHDEAAGYQRARQRSLADESLESSKQGESTKGR